MKPVQIFGGGMAGLSAAFLLYQNNIPFEINEYSNFWGGKLRTTRIEGFSLDHGFQVIQSAYPALKPFRSAGLLDGSRAFGSGAWLLTHSKKTLLANPLNHPLQSLKTLLSPNLKLSDIIKVAKLRSQLLSCSPESFFDYSSTSMSTQEFLMKFGFNEAFIESFFRPFFTGIFLEEALVSPQSMFKFVFWALCKGKALMLPQGVQTLPNRIAEMLPENSKFLGSRQLPYFENPSPHKSTSILYFEVDSDLGLGKFLAVNASRMGRINLICVPSQVQHSYAPKGKHLLAVSLRPSDSQTIDEHTAKQQVLTEIESLLQQPVKADFIKSFRIEKALPTPLKYEYSLNDFEHAQNKPIDRFPVFYAGKNIGSPSLNAAILSGFDFANKTKQLLNQ